MRAMHTHRSCTHRWRRTGTCCRRWRRTRGQRWSRGGARWSRRRPPCPAGVWRGRRERKRKGQGRVSGAAHAEGPLNSWWRALQTEGSRCEARQRRRTLPTPSLASPTRRTTMPATRKQANDWPALPCRLSCTGGSDKRGRRGRAGKEGGIVVSQGRRCEQQQQQQGAASAASASPKAHRQRAREAAVAVLLGNRAAHAAQRRAVDVDDVKRLGGLARVRDARLQHKSRLTRGGRSEGGR